MSEPKISVLSGCRAFQMGRPAEGGAAEKGRLYSTLPSDSRSGAAAYQLYLHSLWNRLAIIASCWRRASMEAMALLLTFT